MNKRGESATLQTIIFIVLNIMFLGIMVTFAVNESKGTSLYEQGFAKEIGLMIDSARPGMNLFIDISKAREIADKNGFTGQIVSIDDTKNIVKVQLSNNRGYSFSYFSDYKIIPTIKTHRKQNYLEIEVTK